MPINELRSITTFTKAVELGSLRRAAAAQGMTPQAASQALAQLEQHLGVRLLHRTTRNIALTAEGRQFLEAAQPALAALERALQGVQLAKDEGVGPLRIVGPRSTFAPIIGPLLDEFCQRYPDVVPDVQLEDRIGNWVQDRVDVGFRLGGQPEEGVIARRLFPLQLIICASPDYLRRYGVPTSLTDLAAHRCSVFRHPTSGRVLPWTVRVDDEVISYNVPVALSTNDAELEQNAVLTGQVMGQLAGTSAAALIRAGRVIPVLTQHACHHYSLFIYYGNRTALPMRVRAFIDFAVERLSDSKEYVLGLKELEALEKRGIKSLSKRL